MWPLCGNTLLSASTSESADTEQCALLYESQILRFGHFEAHPNGIEWHDGGKRLLRIGVNQPAHRDQRVADESR